MPREGCLSWARDHKVGILVRCPPAPLSLEAQGLAQYTLMGTKTGGCETSFLGTPRISQEDLLFPNRQNSQAKNKEAQIFVRKNQTAQAEVGPELRSHDCLRGQPLIPTSRKKSKM